MKLLIETIIEQTKGMTPRDFERYADQNNIVIEWGDEYPMRFVGGTYMVELPDYEVVAYAVNGGPINFKNI